MGRLCALLLVVLALVGCHGAPKTGAAAPADTLRPRHARLLRYLRQGGVEVAELLDPWRGNVMGRYVLVPRGARVEGPLPEGTVVSVPLRRAVSLSSVYVAAAADLDALPRFCGLADARYAMHPLVRRALAEGRLTDVGPSTPPDAERILVLRPDAVLASAYDRADYGALGRAGVPLIPLADYMEPTALGRAEWMIFFGKLLGCEERARRQFRAVEARYVRLRALARGQSERPKVMFDRQEGAVWYAPGRRSTVGQMLVDAGGTYLYPTNEMLGSMALDFERVWACAAQSDVWVVKYGAAADLTRRQLAAGPPDCSRFRPMRLGRVWGCNTMRVPYYDETPFRPDRLLADWVKLLHPQLLPGHRMRYFSLLAP